MRVHHLSCGSMCPFGRRFLQADGGYLEPADLVCHCLLIETDAGLVLVDTGLGAGDVKEPARLSRRMRLLLRPRLAFESTAIDQLRLLGFAPEDVRHVVLTHLDFDHAGGLGDFPHARVHLLSAEHDAATRARRPGGHLSQGRARYRPKQWAHRPHWQLYDDDGGDPWFGFRAVRELSGLPPEILLIPLLGHTPGHAGVAVQTPQGWLLHAGDAYFFHAEMNPRHPWCPLGLAGYQTLMEWDRSLRLENQRRLRGLVRSHGEDVRVFCAHDPRDLRAMQARVKVDTPRPTELPNGESRPRPSL